jgi:general stress protein 26
MDSVKEKISNYLTLHNYLNLGTVSPGGTPTVHTVGFVSEGATVWFITDKTSRKATNIMNNPAVAFTVDEDYRDIAVIQGVQMEGTASLVTEEADVQRVFGLIMSKFPQIRDLPENPNYVVFKIEPKAGYFLDNTVEFGHRDSATY